MNEKECRNIYRQAFCDPDTSFEDLLFKYCGVYCKSLVIDGKTVSILFALPIHLKTSDRNIVGAYIYAAATDNSYRKKGYMAELLEKVKKEYEFLLLRPATKPLINYYKKFGFMEIATDFNSNIAVLPQKGYDELIKNSGLNDNDEQFTAMYYSKDIKDIKTIKFNYSMN